MDFYDCKRVGESIFKCNFVGNAEMEEQEESVNGYINVENVPIP